MSELYLDSLPLLKSQVGYGGLGMHGSLGYEGKMVSVRRQKFGHAFSTHPPARLRFHLGGRFLSFSSRVALNDDVLAGTSHANFIVFADGQRVAIESFVRAGDSPRMISAAIVGAQSLELLVNTSRWEYCHAVWLDPEVSETAVANSARTLNDCLNRVEIVLPEMMPKAERCIATVVSPGFEGLLDDLLGSIRANGNCDDSLIIVFGVDTDDACRKVVEKQQALMVLCRKRSPINCTVKSVLYTAPRIIDANQFLCLDADMLVLGDLRPVFATLEACPDGSILACREANARGPSTLDNAIANIYGGRGSDFSRLLGTLNGERSYPLVVNDGTFAGNATALLALDGVIRSWPQAAAWVDERRDVTWRNQFIFNLALAHLDCGVELDPVYNLQLHFQNAELIRRNDRIEAWWQGRATRVLHFNGWGRNKYPEWRGLFALTDGPGGDDKRLR